MEAARLPRRDAEMVLSDRPRRVNSADYHPRSCRSLRSFVQEWEEQAFASFQGSLSRFCVYWSRFIVVFVLTPLNIVVPWDYD